MPGASTCCAVLRGGNSGASVREVTRGTLASGDVVRSSRCVASRSIADQSDFVHVELAALVVNVDVKRVVGERYRHAHIGRKALARDTCALRKQHECFADLGSLHGLDASSHLLDQAKLVQQ